MEYFYALIKHLLDTQENPELIWNDEAREKVSGVVGKLTGE